MTCPQCQADCAPGAKFCMNCGTAQAVRCPGCQAAVAPGAKFCAECGTRVAAGAPAAPAVPPQEAVRPPTLTAQGDRRVVTVLFAEVAGVKAMAEKLDPEQVTEVVNTCFSELTEPIYRFGGVVDKYIGDVIMALFGAPVAHEDDPERAVAAAWEMQQVARGVADRLEQRTGIRMQVRIGLNTGLVVAGAVGGSTKRDYTVMGDTVNLAQRMEANAPADGVLVTEETMRLASGAWAFATREPIRVKGKAEPVPVFDLAGPKAADAAEAWLPPFVGRSEELRRLAGTLDEACAGRPQVVTVVGEAGLGKSRLAREFLKLAVEGQGRRVLRGRMLSYQQGVGYALVGSLVADWLGMQGVAGADAVDRLRAWAASQGEAGDEGLRLADLIGHFLGLAPSHPELVHLTPEQLRNLAFATLNGRLLRGQGPLVVALTDLHWIDDSSRAWLSSFYDALAAPAGPGDGGAETGAQVLVLVLHRPLEANAAPLPAPPSTIAAERLDLGPLSPAEEADLAEGLLGLDELPPEVAPVVQQAIDRAEGNPMFLSELIRSLTEAEVLRREGGAWALGDAEAGLQLPATVHGVIAARLDRLAPGAREVVQLAAVVGRTFRADLLAEVRGVAVLAELAQLQAANLVHPRRDGTHGFNQALIQETAYQGLLLKLRREVHKRVGLAIERHPETHPTDLVAVLAHHFLQAEDDAKAFGYLVEAGKQAAGRFGNAEAQEAFGHALAVLDRSPQVGATTDRAGILQALAEVEALTGQNDQALEHLAEALRCGVGSPQLAELHKAAGGIHERTGAYAEALASYGAGLAALEGREASGASDGALGASRGGMLAKVAYVHYRLGDYQEADRLCREALALLPAEPSKDLGFCHMVLGLIAWRQGDLDAATQSQQEARRIRAAISDLHGVGSALNNLASIAAERGDLAGAQRHFTEALSTFERMGDRYWVSMVQMNLGNVTCMLGDNPGALRWFGQALATCRSIRSQANEATILGNMGEVHGLDGRFDEAERATREALAIAEAISAKELIPAFTQNLGETLQRQGRHAEAKQAYERVHRLATVAGAPAKVSEACRRIAEVERLAGSAQSAVAWAARAVSGLGGANPQGERGRAYAELCRALVHAGQGPLARDAFERAVADLDAAGLEAERATLASWYESLEAGDGVPA